jgi:hypothetical protein
MEIPTTLAGRAPGDWILRKITFFFSVLEIEPRVLDMLGKVLYHWTTILT